MTTPVHTPRSVEFFFFFNDTATTEIYTLSLHDALPISRAVGAARHRVGRRGARGALAHERSAGAGARSERRAHHARGRTGGGVGGGGAAARPPRAGGDAGGCRPTRRRVFAPGPAAALHPGAPRRD